MEYANTIEYTDEGDIILGETIAGNITIEVNAEVLTALESTEDIPATMEEIH